MFYRKTMKMSMNDRKEKKKEKKLKKKNVPTSKIIYTCIMLFYGFCYSERIVHIVYNDFDKSLVVFSLTCISSLLSLEMIIVTGRSNIYIIRVAVVFCLLQLPKPYLHQP
jgi:uncharacterized membrane protein YadS